MKEIRQPIPEERTTRPTASPEEVEFHTVQLGEWELTYSSQERVFSTENVHDGLSTIAQWEEAFAPENTWVRQQHQVPSLFIRLDATVQDGKLAVYEVEERPSGIGLTSLFNPQFKENLERMKGIWPQFEGIISDDPRRRGGDDHLWLPIGNKENPSDLVLVRSEPEEEEFHPLEERSVSSLKEKGNKEYGEKIGMWRSVEHPDELDFDDSFVIKPKRGSKTRDVFIYIPKDQTKQLSTPNAGRVPGAYSRGKIERVITEAADKGGMYCQPFYAPMESNISDDYRWMIYRVFYGYNLETREWECMGGSWNARPNLKIHGAGDSLCGPVVVEGQQ